MKLRLFLIVMVVLLAATPVALAASPHFVSSSAAVNGNTGALVVSFKSAGLGANVTTDYTVKADLATVNWACYNKGSNTPNSDLFKGESSNIVVTAPFTSGKNGTITGTITADAPAKPEIKCPSKQMSIKVVNATYTNVQLFDAAGNEVDFGDVKYP